MRIKMLDELARKKVFTVEEVARISGIDKNVLKVLLSRLEKKGWIERIEKGKYMVIPLGARKGEYTLNEFVIGSLLVNPSAIVYWSALNYHGLTEQDFCSYCGEKRASEMCGKLAQTSAKGFA